MTDKTPNPRKTLSNARQPQKRIVLLARNKTRQIDGLYALQQMALNPEHGISDLDMLIYNDYQETIADASCYRQ